MLFGIGFAVAAVGWAFMLFGVGSNGGYAGFEVANLHAVQIAQGIINGGYALIVAGAVKQGVDRVCVYLGGNADMRAAFERSQMYQSGNSQSTSAPADDEVLANREPTPNDVADLERRLQEARKKAQPSGV